MKCFRYAAFLLLMVGYCSLFAQKGAFTLEPTIGLAAPLLSSGAGVYVGGSVEYRLFRLLAVEGHVAYTRVKITRGFLGSPGGRWEKTAGVYTGPRLYLAGSRTNTSLYLNFLLGPMHTRERADADRPVVTGTEISGTLGLYVRSKPGFFGVALGPFGNVVLRAGASLPMKRKQQGRRDS